MKQTSKTKKQITHERIVKASARAIRKSGYTGTSVSDIMKSAGLTHGGFYAHFESREAMLAEAVDLSGADTVAFLARVAAAAPRGHAASALISAYLSKAHAERIEDGCPIAALGSETPRQVTEIRQAATRRIKEMIDLVARESPDWGQPENHKHALVTVVTMVGALVLARSVEDSQLSDALLAATLEHLVPGG